MTIGSQSDFASRLLAVLPARWFGSAPPVLTGVLNGLGNAWAAIYSQIQYTILQTRIATATGSWLDGISQDYNGGTLPRLLNEPDAAFSARIRANFFTAQGTRAGVIADLVALTGRKPVIIEPANTGDCGGWDEGVFAYDTAGCWGETDLPFQFFIKAYRKLGGGIASVDGWDGSYGGWDAGAIEWTDSTLLIGQVTDANIYATIAAACPASVTAWAQLSS